MLIDDRLAELAKQEEAKQEEERKTRVRLTRDDARRQFIKAISTEEAMEKVVSIKEALIPIYDQHRSSSHLTQDDFDCLVESLDLAVDDYHLSDVFSAVSTN